MLGEDIARKIAENLRFAQDLAAFARTKLVHRAAARESLSRIHAIWMKLREEPLWLDGFLLQAEMLRLYNIGSTGATYLACACFHGALAHLTYLGLECDSNSISCDGVTALASACARGALPSLTALHLCNNKIGDTGCSVLVAAARRGLVHLTDLGIGKNNIGDFGIEAVASACAKGAFSYLKFLDISDNHIGSAGCSALASACAAGALVSLCHLKLARNLFGDAGCTALALTLARMKTLDLDGNAITDAGCKALASAWHSVKLRNQLCLEEFVISDNQICSDGCKDLISECASKTLKVLDLSGNMIGDLGCEHIGCYAEHLASLEELSLERNSIGAGFVCLALAKRKLCSLQTLHLRNNVSDDLARELLMTAYSRNGFKLFL